MFTVSSKKRTRVQCINWTWCRTLQIKVGMNVNYGWTIWKKSNLWSTILKQKQSPRKIPQTLKQTENQSPKEILVSQSWKSTNVGVWGYSRQSWYILVPFKNSSIPPINFCSSRHLRGTCAISYTHGLPAD